MDPTKSQTTQKIPGNCHVFFSGQPFFCRKLQEVQPISPGATVQTSPCKRKDSQRFIFSQGLKGHDHLVCTDFMHNRLGKPGTRFQNATQRNATFLASPNILQFTPKVQHLFIAPCSSDRIVSGQRRHHKIEIL